MFTLSLRNGFTAYCALTPGYRAFLPPSPCGIWHVSPVGFFMPPQNLTPTSEASGPHAFAVRFGIVRPARRCPLTEKPPCEHTSRPTPSRPPHPVPTFGDDGQRPFPRGQDGVIRKGDLPDVESGILPDGLICRIPSGRASRPVLMRDVIPGWCVSTNPQVRNCAPEVRSFAHV